MLSRDLAALILSAGTKCVICQLHAPIDLPSWNTSLVPSSLEALFALEKLWKVCRRDEYFCVAWNRATIPRVFSSLLTYDTCL